MDTIFMRLGEALIFLSWVSIFLLPFILPFIFYNSKTFEKYGLISFILDWICMMKWQG